mgnify:CR=1 FL=1
MQRRKKFLLPKLEAVTNAMPIEMKDILDRYVSIITDRHRSFCLSCHSARSLDPFPLRARLRIEVYRLMTLIWDLGKQSVVLAGKHKNSRTYKVLSFPSE